MELYITRSDDGAIERIGLYEGPHDCIADYANDGWQDDVTPLLNKARELARYAPDDMPSDEHIIEAIMQYVNG